MCSWIFDGFVKCNYACCGCCSAQGSRCSRGHTASSSSIVSHTFPVTCEIWCAHELESVCWSLQQYRDGEQRSPRCRGA